MQVCLDPRNTPGGFVYHVLNRATARLTLFRKPGDYHAFLGVLGEALQRHPTRMLAYCLMPTHWHFVLWPEADNQLTTLLRWLTLTHSVRWQKHSRCVGSGHVYQNRLKAFAVAEDDRLYAVLRYVERNPLRAGLVQRAERWAWSSLANRVAGGESASWLHPWPVPMPEQWVPYVNEPQTEAELAAVRCSVIRGRPYGPEAWVAATVRQLGLEATMRSRGRPCKHRTQEPSELRRDKIDASQSCSARLLLREGNAARGPKERHGSSLWLLVDEDRKENSAQQRTPHAHAANERWLGVVGFQFFEMGQQLLLIGPADEVETNHLVGPLRRLLAGPQGD